MRLLDPKARREAITNRPWLITSMGRCTERARQTTITLTAMHAGFRKARDALIQVNGAAGNAAGTGVCERLTAGLRVKGIRRSAEVRLSFHVYDRSTDTGATHLADSI